MPVLPAVPSTTRPPGLSSPRFSASRIIWRAGPVLHRAAGIHELGLAEDGAAGRGRGAFELDQRRIADGFDDAVADLHGLMRPFAKPRNLVERPSADKAMRAIGKNHAPARALDRPSRSLKPFEPRERVNETIAAQWRPAHYSIHHLFPTPTLGMTRRDGQFLHRPHLRGWDRWDLDVNTLFLVTIYVEAMLGLLLLFAWVQNSGITRVAWWGCAHLLRAGSVMLFGMYGTVLRCDLDRSRQRHPVHRLRRHLDAARGCSTAARREPIVSGRRRGAVDPRLPRCRCSPTRWTPRVLLTSGIITAYTWATAYEFWRGRSEPLVSRWPAIFMLFAHGALFLLRTPLVAGAAVVADQPGVRQRVARPC